MKYPDPNGIQSWLQAANERGKDVAALHDANRHLGAFYMLGYLIELKLKALAFSGKKKTEKIHDLRELWEQCGFRLTDISGNKRAFVDAWCVSLRYQSAWPEIPGAYEELYKGALELAQYIQYRIRH